MDRFNQALNCLKNGKVIVYPTESCYSFGCDARNQNAINRINHIKKRSLDKPITLMVSDLDQIRQFGIFNKTAKKLSNALMPAQINLIIDSKDKDNKNGISFRIPAN